MAKYSLEEWWAIYCLYYGPHSLDQPYMAGEREFLEQVSVDLDTPHFKHPVDDESALRRRRTYVLNLFMTLREEEFCAASKP